MPTLMNSFRPKRALRCALFLSLVAGCQGQGTSQGGGGGDGGSSDLAMPIAGAPDQAMPAPALCTSPPGSLALAQDQARNCSIGTGAPFILRAAPYPKMIIEINATAGATPRLPAIDHLKTLIADVCGKPGGVTVVMGDINIPAPGHPLSIAEVRAIEDAHRKSYASGDTAVFYYLVVSDPSSDDTNQFKILGYAHRASSMVVFQGSVDSVSGGLGKPSAATVESTVVAHEFGHVLGLVNIGTKMQQNHEDAAHLGHDLSDKCLMYYANNSSLGLANLLGGGAIPDLDAPCRVDLAAVKNGQ